MTRTNTCKSIWCIVDGKYSIIKDFIKNYTGYLNLQADP